MNRMGKRQDLTPAVVTPSVPIMADLVTMQFEIITVEAAAASVLPPVTPHV